MEIIFKIDFFFQADPASVMVESIHNWVAHVDTVGKLSQYQ